MKLLWRKFLSAPVEARVEVAANRSPGTRFDSFFERAQRAVWFHERGFEGNAQREYAALGAAIADAIARQDVQTLYELTNALAVAKAHARTARPDFTLLSLAQLSQDFSTVAPRDVLALLAEHDPEFDPEKKDTYLKRIRRLAKRFGFSLDSSPGRPPAE